MFCQVPKLESIGSVWAVALDEPAYKKYHNVFITNRQDLTLDEENDLAVIVADLKIPVLYLSPYQPQPGFWTMLVGSADAYVGSVAFGSVFNYNESQILITANASLGNSSGLIVDNEGRVIGTLAGWFNDLQYNLGPSLYAMCAKIIKCEGEFCWE